MNIVESLAKLQQLLEKAQINSNNLNKVECSEELFEIKQSIDRALNIINGLGSEFNLNEIEFLKTKKTHEVIDYLRNHYRKNHNKIQVIRLWMGVSKTMLKEAKDFVESTIQEKTFS